MLLIRSILVILIPTFIVMALIQPDEQQTTTVDEEQTTAVDEEQTTAADEEQTSTSDEQQTVTADKMNEMRQNLRRSSGGIYNYWGKKAYSGEGEPKDYKKAVEYFLKGAEVGHADAQFNLGLMYRNGQGVLEDHAEAAKWWRKSATQGNTRAQISLGFSYYGGQGVPQNLAEAEKWWRKAAEQGEALSQYLLGMLYVDGKGVPQDYKEAYIWISLAELSENQETAERADIDIVKMKNWIADKLSRSDRRAAQKEVSRRHAEIQATSQEP